MRESSSIHSTTVIIFNDQFQACIGSICIVKIDTGKEKNKKKSEISLYAIASVFTVGKETSHVSSLNQPG